LKYDKQKNMLYPTGCAKSLMISSIPATATTAATIIIILSWSSLNVPNLDPINPLPTQPQLTSHLRGFWYAVSALTDPLNLRSGTTRSTKIIQA
jgi:hypothetical protein